MNSIHTRRQQWRVFTVLQLLVGLLISLSALSQPVFFLNDGLVAYYPFNGTTKDGSGNENDGRSIGVINYGADRFGAEGKAIATSSGFIAGADLSRLGDLTKTGTISISLWFNYTFSEYNSNIKDPWIFAFCLPDGAGLFQVNTRNGGLASEGLGGFALNPRFKINHWYAVAIIVDTTLGFTKVFVNGQLLKTVDSGTSNWLANQAGARLVLGGDRYATASRGFPGLIDEVRIYNRALSHTEVKALYDYESLNPRVATATVQVINGIVVGAVITDGGYGYTNHPTVTIFGGGGSGAKATATQVNGVVTGITITNPGSGYTNVPNVTIAPPPMPFRTATATSQAVNGFVVGADVKDGGFGYDAPPAILLIGGGGSGATATATVLNGVVTAVTITNPGTGYTSAPKVQIASPPFAPSLVIQVSKVTVRLKVVLGRKYQLEASTDLNAWTATGPVFVAQAEELIQEFDVNQVGRYFRINEVQ